MTPMDLSRGGSSCLPFRSGWGAGTVRRMTSGRLAGYLKARRKRLQPEDVGLVVGLTTRRVQGLRREEVAILAGISTDYYLRLEQGHDVHPSDQVVDALARALQLDNAGTVYLRGLARPTRDARNAVDAQAGDDVHDNTQWLIDSWPLTASVVHNRYIDVLASNALARALNPNYTVGVNGLLSLLNDPSERVFHADWEGLASRSVALLRAMADSQDADPRLEAIVAEGSRTSAIFRQSWERQDVRRVGDGTHVVRHPVVGEMTLRYMRLPLVDTDGQSIFLYLAQPGTPSEAALAALVPGRQEPAG